MNRIQSKVHRIGTYEIKKIYYLILMTKYILKTMTNYLLVIRVNYKKQLS